MSSVASHSRVKIVALCDVDSIYLDQAAKTHPDASRHKDWRELLADHADKFDAVTIGTPDHMHAAPTVTAIHAGKHLYLQKPMATTLHECRVITHESAKAGVITQLGNQGRSSVESRMTVELIRSGAIGKIKEVILWENWPVKRRDFLQTVGRTAAAGAVSTTLAGSKALPAAVPAQRVKVGQIGTTHAHAAGKMATLRKLRDQYDVIGVVESDAAARNAAQRHEAYRDLKWMSEEELLNTSGLQAVAVECSVPSLLSTAARCVEAGMHLHLDKPAGRSLTAFRNLMDEAARKGLTVQMGYMFRNNPAFQFCFRAVREGWLGDIFEIDAVISKKLSAARRLPLAQFRGGAMFELGCHLIDATVAVMGKPERVTSFLRRTRPDSDPLADNTLAVLEYPRATCTIRSALVEVEGVRRRQFVVCGEQGTVDIRPLEPPKVLLSLESPRDSFLRGTQEVPMPKMAGRYDDQLIELARAIRGEIESPYSRAHDLAVQETILRASGMPLTAASE